MKKTLSVCLALLMLLSCFAVPTTAFAAAPKKPTVSSVSAGAAAFTVKWKKVSGVTGYQVQYSTSSKFTSKTSKTATAKKDKTTAKTVSGLKSKTKYYVRVRTYKTSGKKKKYSSWSSAKSVTTKVAKVNFKSVSAERLGFTAKWSKAPSVSVQYSTSSKFDKKVTKALKVTNGNATSATITGLKGGKKYYVRVQAYVNQGKKSYSGAYSAAKKVTTAKDPFKKGKYAGVQLNTTADAVRYYVKAYNATKKETAKYKDLETEEIYICYKMLGCQEMFVTNTRINGSKNSFFDSYFESLLTDLTMPTGLPPSTSVNKSADTDLNGKSLITSRLRDTDVASLSIKDNKNGTVTLTIKPKAVQMSSPGADPQGRFFTTAGPMYDAIDQVIKENGGKWTTGNAKKNVTMNYTGGIGTITINTSTGKISKAMYKMIVKAEIRNITLSGQKFKSIAMDCSKVDTFPATGSNFADWGIALV